MLHSQLDRYYVLIAFLFLLCTFDVPLLYCRVSALHGKSSFVLRAHEMISSPDGIPRRHLAFNGSIPGPVLHIDRGDEIDILLLNDLDEGTTIHWHGIEQSGFAFMDGVPYITQCPVDGDSSMVYSFTPIEIGTYWYHSHMKSQRADGLFGALLIDYEIAHSHEHFDVEKLLVVSDWFWYEYEYIMEYSEAKGHHMPLFQTFLLNGKIGNNCTHLVHLRDKGELPYPWPDDDFGSPVECVPTSYEVISVNNHFRPLLQIIGAMSTFLAVISIDGHQLSIFAIDGINVEHPGQKWVDEIVISSGEVYDVLLQRKNFGESRFWIRSTRYLMDQIDRPVAMDEFRLGILSYVGSDPLPLPTTSKLQSASWIRADIMDSINQGETASTVINEPDHVHQLTFEHAMAEHKWMVNGIAYSVSPTNLESPLISTGQELAEGTSTQIWLETNQSIRVILNNPFYMAWHPIHLHGHFFQVLGVGQANEGVYNATLHEHTLDTTAPIKKHTLNIPRASWAVIQFDTINPGHWIMHCHLEHHSSVGFAMIWSYFEHPRESSYPEFVPICTSSSSSFPWHDPNMELAFVILVAVVLMSGALLGGCAKACCACCGGSNNSHNPASAGFNHFYDDDEDQELELDNLNPGAGEGANDLHASTSIMAEYSLCRQVCTRFCFAFCPPCYMCCCHDERRNRIRVPTSDQNY